MEKQSTTTKKSKFPKPDALARRHAGSSANLGERILLLCVLIVWDSVSLELRQLHEEHESHHKTSSKPVFEAQIKEWFRRWSQRKREP